MKPIIITLLYLTTFGDIKLDRFEIFESCSSWYDRNVKVEQRKQRKVSGEPTISAGQVYFPIFKPSPGDPCAEGVAFICTLDDECGTNNISLIGSNSTTYTNERCLHVGMGVLSKPIIHNRIIYNAIAGESIVGNQDLVILPSAEVDPTTYRINWREN